MSVSYGFECLDEKEAVGTGMESGGGINTAPAPDNLTVDDLSSAQDVMMLDFLSVSPLDGITCLDAMAHAVCSVGCEESSRLAGTDILSGFLSSALDVILDAGRMELASTPPPIVPPSFVKSFWPFLLRLIAAR